MKSTNYLTNLLVRSKNLIYKGFSTLVVKIFYIFVSSYSKNNISIEKDLILVCRYDFYGKNKNMQSSDYFYIDKYFEEIGLNFSTFYWDNPLRNFPDLPFMKQVLSQRPSRIIMMGYNFRSTSCPRLSTLTLIKKKLKTEIFSIWGDTGAAEFIQNDIDVFASGVFDKHICIDNPALNLNLDILDEQEQKKFLKKMYTPESEKIYYPIENKDIDVSFLGQTQSYRDYRTDYLEYAEEHLKNFKTYFSGKERIIQVDHDTYASILNRSKIGINFSRSVNIDQLKGRVIHTMLSGALLLETKNIQVEYLFEDGRDYISFTSKEEMLDKIKFYLQNDKIRDEIANNGRQKVLSVYSRENFWGKVLT